MGSLLKISYSFAPLLSYNTIYILVQKAVNIKFDEDETALKKSRSDIIVSTADDLHQIVTHAKNLFYKYNTIARAHSKKVSWAMISKELGIHVKVREKYNRMHSRAIKRNFDFKKCAHYKIKNHPEIFLEPMSKKLRKAPVADTNTSTHTHTAEEVSISPADNDALSETLIHQPLHHAYLHETHDHDVSSVHHSVNLHHNDPMPSVPDTHNETVHHDHLTMYSRDMSQHITDDQVAAAVDAAIKTVPVNQPTDYTAEAAEAALTAGTNQFGAVDDTTEV